ncbi:unnamed protein product, partial [Vitis vinifera]
MDCQALGLVWQPFGPIIRICWSSNAFSHFFSFGSVLKIEDLGRYGSRLSRSIWLSLRCLGRFWRGLSGLRISFVAFSEREISMAFLFQKFQEAVKTLAKSPVFARDPRHLQFEADINRLFLYTSYNRLGRNADEADAENIIDMAGKASLADQQKQVQENIHSQIKTFCNTLDGVLLPDSKNMNELPESCPQTKATPRRSGLSFAVGRDGPPSDNSAVPQTKPLKRAELSQSLKDLIGYTLDLKPSQIPHKDAGQGLFLDGEADVGAVVALYPGVIYFPAYYQYIPGYPRVDAHNPYLITSKPMEAKHGGSVKMKRLGSFWFKSGSSNKSELDAHVPVLKTLVLVATRALCDEEVLLNYRLSNSKRRPAWYTPVDEEEDRRRWS